MPSPRPVERFGGYCPRSTLTQRPEPRTSTDITNPWDNIHGAVRSAGHTCLVHVISGLWVSTWQRWARAQSAPRSSHHRALPVNACAHVSAHWAQRTWLAVRLGLCQRFKHKQPPLLGRRRCCDALYFAGAPVAPGLVSALGHHEAAGDEVACAYSVQHSVQHRPKQPGAGRTDSRYYTRLRVCARERERAHAPPLYQ